MSIGRAQAQCWAARFRAEQDQRAPPRPQTLTARSSEKADDKRKGLCLPGGSAIEPGT